MYCLKHLRTIPFDLTTLIIIAANPIFGLLNDVQKYFEDTI